MKSNDASENNAAQERSLPGWWMSYPGLDVCLPTPTIAFLHHAVNNGDLRTPAANGSPSDGPQGRGGVFTLGMLCCRLPLCYCLGRKGPAHPVTRHLGGHFEMEEGNLTSRVSFSVS